MPSWPRSPSAAFPTSVPPSRGRRTRRSPSAPSPATTAARISSPCDSRRAMPGRRNAAPCSSRPANGCAHNGSRNRGESDWLTSVKREVTAVRRGVGVCDVSTLGKIDVQGPDAGEFLGPPLHQRHVHRRRREDPLRTHAARGRSRDGRWYRRPPATRAFRRVDHHRECRQDHAAHGARPAGAVADARRADGLDHGTMVAIRHRRSALAGIARAAVGFRDRPCGCRVSLHGVPRIFVARRPPPACSASPSRASGLSNLPSPRGSATPRYAPS